MGHTISRNTDGTLCTTGSHAWSTPETDTGRYRFPGSAIGEADLPTPMAAVRVSVTHGELEDGTFPLTPSFAAPFKCNNAVFVYLNVDPLVVEGIDASADGQKVVGFAFPATGRPTMNDIEDLTAPKLPKLLSRLAKATLHPAAGLYKEGVAIDGVSTHRAMNITPLLDAAQNEDGADYEEPIRDTYIAFAMRRFGPMSTASAVDVYIGNTVAFSLNQGHYDSLLTLADDVRAVVNAWGGAESSVATSGSEALDDIPSVDNVRAQRPILLSQHDDYTMVRLCPFAGSMATFGVRPCFGLTVWQVAKAIVDRWIESLLSVHIELLATGARVTSTEILSRIAHARVQDILFTLNVSEGLEPLPLADLECYTFKALVNGKRPLYIVFK